MEITEEEKQAFKDFTKDVYNCPCGPTISGAYCNDCKRKVLDFIDKWGMGILCQDITVENQDKKIKWLKGQCSSLVKKLEEKIKRVEELKKEIKIMEKNKNDE